MLLQIRLGALATRTDRHGKILVRVPRRRELKQVRSSLILSDDEEANTIRPTSVLLSVHLRL